MSEETIFDKTLRLPQFSGRNEDWPIWSEKFKIRARRKGYKDLMLGVTPIPKDSERNVDQDIAKLLDLNQLAYEEIEMGIDTSKRSGRVAFDHIGMAKTRENPEGNCHEAWKRLKAKYAPQQAPIRLMLKREFNDKRLTSIEADPDNWMTDLEDIRIRLVDAGGTLSETEFIEHVLNSLPEEYDLTVKLMEKRVYDQSNPLTIMELREELNLEYQRRVKMKRRDNSAFYAGGFPGKCRKCGKYGHKAKFCRDKNNRNNNNKN